MINSKKITVGEVKTLLSLGKVVKVKTINGEFTKITNFVEKGILDTFEVKLENSNIIKVSREHKFYTNSGWVQLQHLLPDKHSILCDDGLYSTVKSITLIGKYRIVDITVDHPDHCYFGNGILNHNTGKSLICAQIVSETQKKGGLAVFFDSEFAVPKDFWKAMGIDFKNLNYVPFNTLEELFNNIELCIGAFRKANKDRLLTIIIDSFAQSSTETEVESEHGVDGYNTSKSIIMSKAMRKITSLIATQKILVVFTNQVRFNMNAGPFADKWCVDPFTTKVKIKYKIK